MNKNINGLTLFIESACADHRLLQKAEVGELRESLAKCPSRIRESVDSSAPAGWWVPISFYNKVNGNNRNYSRDLWENVMDSQKDTWCGSPMLCDHPSGDSDGNPKDICGVWLDMKLGEPNMNGTGLVYGLLMPSGRHGCDLQDHLKNGLKIGTSSSGFGKLMKDGVTVDPDTYRIERLADWVLQPSQGTFFSYDESSDEVVDRSENMAESIKYTNENITKETHVKDSKLTRLEEKKFRRDMESFLESANSIVDPQERLEEFKDIRSYFEEGVCPDLKEKVEAKISEQEAEIKKMLKERLEMKEELGIESVKDLKEKLTTVVEDSKIVEKEAQDWKATSSELQVKLDKMAEELENRPSKFLVDSQKETINSLRERLNKQADECAGVVNKLTGAYKSLQESNGYLNNEVKSLKESNENLTKKFESASKVSKDLRGSIESLSEKCALYEEKYKKAIREIKLLKELMVKNKTLFEKASKNTDFLIDSKNMNEKKIGSLKSNLDSANAELRKAQIRESLGQRLIKSDTEEYYDSLRKTYGREIEPFKEAIVGAVTLTEAKHYFYKNVLNNLTESREIADMRLPESMAISADERANYILHESVEKTSSVNRLPKGWK